MNYNFSLLQSMVNTLGASYSTECTDFITKASVFNQTLLLQYLMMSGHGFNQIGDFEGCKQLNGANYYIGEIGEPPVGFIGICFNDQCSTHDVLEFSHEFKKYPFSQVVDPIHEQSVMPVGGYVTLGLLGLFLTLTVISTLLVWYNQKRKGEKINFIEKFDYFSLQRSSKVFKKTG